MVWQYLYDFVNSPLEDETVAQALLASQLTHALAWLVPQWNDLGQPATREEWLKAKYG